MRFCNSILKLKQVLIGLSGGPDSQALLHALLKTPLKIGIAHVDHGWREESQEEARILKAQAEALGLPFYLMELKPEQVTGNLENGFRLKRYEFFSEIAAVHGYEAVALGHHRDDLAETILKRFFEGSSLQAMGGMEKESRWGELLVMRPLLEVSKEAILQFLKQENIPYFEDKTNKDERFLRARMREQMIPQLSAQFGKSVKEPIVRFGRECAELNAFMRKRFQHILQDQTLDCTGIESPFELRWVLKEWFRNLKLKVSYAAIDQIIQWILAKERNKKVLLKDCLIEVNRCVLTMEEL